MTFYALIGFDHPPHSMPLRDSIRAEHRAFVRQHDQLIRFATAMYDAGGNQCGSIYVFEAETPEEVWAWTRNEPFCKAGVYKSVQVIEVRPAHNLLDRKTWNA